MTCLIKAHFRLQRHRFEWQTEAGIGQKCQELRSQSSKMAARILRRAQTQAPSIKSIIC